MNKTDVVKKIKSTLSPYSGIIYFIVILLASNYFWKFTVLGDESDTTVTFLGLNISALFIWMAHHVAEIVTYILEVLNYKIQLLPDNVIKHENGYAIRIVWACTGLKQAYIYFCIIAFYRGPWIKKLWYIPLGLLIVYVFNIFRITFITAMVEKHPGWFEFLHSYLFKYLFYGLIFGMWVIWEEYIVNPKKKRDSKPKIHTKPYSKKLK